MPSRDRYINLTALIGLSLICAGLYTLGGWPAAAIFGGAILFVGAGLSAIKKS